MLTHWQTPKSLSPSLTDSCSLSLSTTPPSFTQTGTLPSLPLLPFSLVGCQWRILAYGCRCRKSWELIFFFSHSLSVSDLCSWDQIVPGCYFLAEKKASGTAVEMLQWGMVPLLFSCAWKCLSFSVYHSQKAWWHNWHWQFVVIMFLNTLFFAWMCFSASVCIHSALYVFQGKDLFLNGHRLSVDWPFCFFLFFPFLRAVVCPEMLHMCRLAAQRKENRFVGLIAAHRNTHSSKKPLGYRMSVGNCSRFRGPWAAFTHTLCGCVMCLSGKRKWDKKGKRGIQKHCNGQWGEPSVKLFLLGVTERRWVTDKNITLPVSPHKTLLLFHRSSQMASFRWLSAVCVWERERMCVCVLKLLVLGPWDDMMQRCNCLTLF